MSVVAPETGSRVARSGLASPESDMVAYIVPLAIVMPSVSLRLMPPAVSLAIVTGP